MTRIRFLFPFLLAAACGADSDFTDCPPGDSVDDWQVISNWDSGSSFTCSRQLAATLSAYGSVWMSTPDYLHAEGMATLSASVRSDCPAGFRVRMTVNDATQTVQQIDDVYRLTASVSDPWLAAVGVMSEQPCMAVVERVTLMVAPTP